MSKVRKRAPRIRAVDSAKSDSLTLGIKLMTLSNLMRRITTLRFQRLFGISLVDGWIVSHLGTGAPMSLDELADRCGLAKSQMSRGVSSMVVRKLVSRQRNPTNNSAVILTLTPDGTRIFHEIRRRWPRYNERLTAGLRGDEVAILDKIVDGMIGNSRRNLLREQKRSNRGDDG